MNPASESPSGGREAPVAKEADPQNKKIPNTDMQPEDAGTPESGNTGRGTATEGTMKQTSKTPAESGTKR